MVRETPVHVDKKLDGFNPHFSHQGRSDNPAASVAAVHRDFHPRLKRDVGHDVLVVVSDYWSSSQNAFRAGGLVRAGFDNLAHLLDLFGKDRGRSNAQLEAIVFSRVVTSRD